jgi:outer membrane protein
MKLSGILLFTLTTCLTAYTQPTSFTIKEAVQYALVNGYSVQNKEMDFQQARQKVKETAAAGLPQFSVGADLNYNARIPQQPVPAAFIPDAPPGQEFVLLEFGVPYQSSYNAKVNQLIFDGSYIVALVASRVYKDISRLELEQSKIDITEQIYNAYGNVVVSKKLISILENNLTASQKTFTENQKLFEEGFLEQQDVDQIELLVTNLENNIVQAKNQHKIAVMMLKLAMGFPQENELILSDDIEAFTEIGNISDALLETQFDLNSYIKFRASETQERAAILTMRNEQMGYLPRLNGFFNYSQNNFGSNFNMFQFSDADHWVPFSVLGLSLQWDIFTGLRRSAKTQQARIDVNRAVMNKRMVSEQAQIDYEKAKGDMTVALKTFHTNKRNRDLAKKILDNTRVKYREGISSSLDLTQAENQFLDTEQKYINALLQLVSARSNLEKIIGNFNTY